MLDLGFKLLLGYLIGSLNGALLMGCLRGIDIRTEGSGNAGATNALRTHGLWFALAVAVIDVGKGVVAVAVVAPLAGFGEPLMGLRWIAAWCGVAAVVGHIFPFWFDFRGGKGGATAVGALAALSPLALLPVFLVWVGTLVLTGYVGLSTMLAGVAMLLYPLLYRPVILDLPGVFYGAAAAALIIFAHRSNIRGMIDGVEHQATGAMFWRRR